MATTMSFVADESFSRSLDRFIKESGLYRSKSEFLRDAARSRLAKFLSLEKELKQVRKAFAKTRKKARFKGYLTRQQKDELVKNYLERP